MPDWWDIGTSFNKLFKQVWFIHNIIQKQLNKHWQIHLLTRLRIVRKVLFQSIFENGRLLSAMGLSSEHQSSGDCPQTRMLFKGFQQTLKESITFSLIAVQHFSSQAVLTHKLENWRQIFNWPVKRSSFGKMKNIWPELWCRRLHHQATDLRLVGICKN